MIFLSRPQIGKEEISSVIRVLRSGWLSSGDTVREFENRFAAFIGASYGIALNSCASALQLAIQVQGLRGEVILPSFTFVASANAVINANCMPRFADIEYGSCMIDVAKIEKLINKNTVAIMPVHYAGQACDMNAIMRIAKKHNLSVIEDSAQAIGATFLGRKSGSFGIGCFSFFPTKNITCGEGGMVTTSDKTIKDKILTYSSHGIANQSRQSRKDNPWERYAKYTGYNYRMSNILAAIGIAQLAKVKRMNEQRRIHAAYLNQHLKKLEELDLPVEKPGCYHTYQMYTIKINSKNIDRDAFVRSLRKRNIEASVHFNPPLHKQKLYAKYLKPGDNLPVTEDLSKKIITLPLYPQISSGELDFIIKNIARIISKSNR